MTNRNADFSAQLVSALSQLGVAEVCITPGSRSTPLAFACADHLRIRDWSHHDERSSAFFALGIARATGRPVAIVTTSGTAAAELYPALIEARYGRVPLIAITADRPSRLRDIGAPQTIDQRDLYGRMTALSVNIEVDESLDNTAAATTALRLVTAAQGPPPGPVHLNLGFEEPLTDEVAVAPKGNHSMEIPPPPPTGDLTDAITTVSARRGVLVVGPQESARAVAAAVRFAQAARWPILADPLSGLRAGGHERSSVIAHTDLLAGAGWLQAVSPEVIVRFGALPTSKPLWRWLESSGRPQIFIEPFGWRDPTGSVTLPLRGDPAATLDALAGAVVGTDGDWLGTWQRADATADIAVDAVLADTAFPNEPAIARMLTTAVPDPSNLWVASSMPIRDVDAFFGTSERAIRLFANRGVNGIDGFLSSALGTASVSPHPTVAIAGDLSALHDLTALATAARLDIAITILVINNDGGGIFHFLPQEGHRHFERHFGTPHGLSFASLAQAFGVSAHSVSDPAELSRLVGEVTSGPRLIEVVTDRAENRLLHDRIREAVKAAINGL